MKKRAKSINRKYAMSVGLSVPLFLNVFVWVHLCLCQLRCFRRLPRKKSKTNQQENTMSVCLSAPLFLNVYVWVHLCLCDCQLYRFRLRRCLSLCLMIWANTLLTFWIHIHHQTFFKSASSAFCSARFIHDTVAIASAHPRH